MGHYAKVVDGIVTEVIVAQQEFIDEYHAGETWIKTSYNTRAGVHYQPVIGGNEEEELVPSEDQSKALRKHYAMVGGVYDSVRDAFYTPQPHPSWTLIEETCLWEAPIPYPTDGKVYTWNEDDYQADNTTGWVEYTIGG